MIGLFLSNINGMYVYNTMCLYIIYIFITSFTIQQFDKIFVYNKNGKLDQNGKEKFFETRINLTAFGLMAAQHHSAVPGRLPENYISENVLSEQNNATQPELILANFC